ncbi:DUF4041 domain-containing protein [Pseudovibrio sp. Ad26]|uniref:DUF4041 domain-containing protein n=1 Tax=Pseudovibrio sp. Ad26 TaxID=989410 RepID=UPI0007AE652F|nr:DUF4041 domain-containing protein [Pseudovibrio sp. Ad26]KZL16474.1 T5orf172 domain protein [Pseudovibrio sp. Ad26]
MEPISLLLLLLLLVWMLSAPALLILWLRNRSQLKKKEKALEEIQEHFAPVLSVEQEVTTLTAEVEKLAEKIQATRETYSEKRKYLDELTAQVAIYDDRLAFAEVGVYEPHFDFADSEEYKDAIKHIRKRQKDKVSSKSATRCPADWTVEGSRSKGQTMVNRQTRLTMRAFNNECEAAIANTRWNNVVAMERRIRNSAKAVNKENSSMQLEISDDYIALKLEELFLTHEYREKQKQEKEERADLARAEREEKKLLAEAKAAEKEEAKYLALIEKARKEANVDGLTDKMKQQIEELESALADAHAVSERAKAMAEMTRSGYVYVISNVGSFGEEIVKIGLTRRLDPSDRVKELGDASVPFAFDTHAMIYSDEAPALEAALHKEFANQRVNMANFRKEFFKISLDEVEKAVDALAPDATFFKDREAQEWHETLARRNELLTSKPDNTLPAEI